ncbi:unnamed protein product, partial [Rotaria magnacalcarata]
MSPTKRQHNDQISISNNHKKRKLEHQNLSNEILYELFEYLDSYDIYKGFYNLNRRFQNLAINSNV